MAPTVVEGKMLIGTNGGEYGIRGFVKAYDAKNGKLIWNLDTIPENPSGCGRPRMRQAAISIAISRPKRKPRQERRSLQTLGGGVWQNPSIDLAANRIYFVVGNPSPDLDGSNRPGDNLYPTRWSRWISIPASTSAITSTSPTTSGISTLSARRCSYVKGKAARPFRRYPRRQDRAHLRARSQGLQPDTLLEAMVPQENMWVLPTKEGARMLPGANGGVEWSPMATDPGLAWPMRSTCTSR